MTKFAKTLITAATLAAALATGYAQAAGPKDSTFPGDKYGYNLRSANGKFDPFTEGARVGKTDPFTEGARAGKFDPFTEGARVSNRDGYVAGLDRVGASASPAHNGKRDPFTDGARTGKFDPFTEGALA